MKNKIICIGGPTGVGKTNLSITLAKQFNGEIISCDSIAIYKHLNIGSAKPTIEEQSQAVHYQIDIVEPNMEYSVAEYVESTRKIIDQIIKKGKTPIIVGGTGLFMKALLFPYEFMNSSKNEEIRKKYEKMAQEKGNQCVYDHLQQIDPESAQKLHINDLKRVIRAIEIFETTGKKKVNNSIQESFYNYKLIFLNGDRKDLYDRINKRVDIMINNGLEGEITSLIKDYNLTINNQSMQGIGYKEWFDYFANKTTKEQLIEAIKQNSRHYAKRQITWFKAMPKVCEYNYKNVDKIIQDVKTFLEKGENMNLTIAIDGPAGAGKTTIAKILADKMGIGYLNTGAMYRTYAVKCLNNNLNPEDSQVANEIAKTTNIDVKFENGEQIMFLDGERLTINLHTDIISEYASKISKHNVIREKCVELQRYIASKESIIVDGRDIGSVVLKNANYKFYLDAKVEERAKRRYNDLVKENPNVKYEEVLEDMKQRDYNDMNRKTSPLIVAEGAIVIDSTNLNIDQVVEKMISIMKEI